MDSLPPDPYVALGVPRDSTAAVIKTAYRKAALKCHPDKVPGKGEEFYKIQQAYEILGDESKRQKYHDESRLADLRKNMAARRASSGGAGSGPGSPYVDVRTAAFDVRNSPNPMGTGFTARGPARVYEEKKPAHKSSYEDEADDYFGPTRTNSRKWEGYDSSRRPQDRPQKPSYENQDTRAEKLSPREKEKITQKKKQQQQEQVRSRRAKQSFVEKNDGDSDSDGDGVFADVRNRALGGERSRYEPTRRESKFGEDAFQDDYFRKMQSWAAEREDYISRSRAEGSIRMGHNSPSPPLDSNRMSYHQGEQQYDVRRGGHSERPSVVRRSSTKPKERSATEQPPRLSRRDSTTRRSSDTPDLPTRDASIRRPPTLHQSHSSPPIIQDPTEAPRRSRTYTPETSIPAQHPSFRRAETMPTNGISGAVPTAQSTRPVPRRSDATPVVSSNLRHTETHDSGYSTSSPSDETVQPDTYFSHSQQQQQPSQPPPSSFNKFQKYYYAEPQSTEDLLPTPREREPKLSRSNSTRQQRNLSPPQMTLPTRERSTSHKSRPTLSRTASTHHSTRETSSPVSAAPEPRERSKTASSSRRPSMSRTDSVRAVPSRTASMDHPPFAQKASHISERFSPSKSHSYSGSPKPDIDIEATAGAGTPNLANVFFEDATRSTSPAELYRRGTVQGSRRTQDRDSGSNGRNRDSMRPPSMAFPGLNTMNDFTSNGINGASKHSSGLWDEVLHNMERPVLGFSSGGTPTGGFSPSNLAAAAAAVPPMPSHPSRRATVNAGATADISSSRESSRGAAGLSREKSMSYGHGQFAAMREKPRSGNNSPAGTRPEARRRNATYVY